MKKILRSGNIIFSDFEASRRGLCFDGAKMINNTDKTILIRESYHTVANGWSDEVKLQPGESLREISKGNAYSFGKYELSQC